MTKLLILCGALFLCAQAQAESLCAGGMEPGTCVCAVGSQRKNCSTSGVLTNTNTGNSTTQCCKDKCSTEGFSCMGGASGLSSADLSKSTKLSAAKKVKAAKK